MSNSEKFDVYQAVTDRIVAAIESAGDFTRPWIASDGASMKRPINIASAKPYNGVNILSLWVAAQACGFASNLWGTYRQWQERGCQVRRGEKSSLIVFYKKLEFERADEETGEPANAERLMARASFVFNAAQVDGFRLESTPLPEAAGFDSIPNAERFAAATGARIEEGGEAACYVPSMDKIRMPDRRRFIGSETRPADEAYYATLFHELIHWSGAKSRLDRDLSGRFGTEAYAMEELVAELGAAFLSSELEISGEPRADHACYIANWLKVLKNDKRAIFTAASQASQAATWLQDLQ